MARPPKVDLMENTIVHSVDERKGCRSLLCDSSGIIIAEMVYRCMVCYSIHDFIGDVSKHYHTVHMNDGDEESQEITNDEDIMTDQSHRNLNLNNNGNSNLLTIGNKRNVNLNHLHNQNNTTTKTSNTSTSTSTTTTTSNNNNNNITKQNKTNIDNNNNNNYLSDHSNNYDESWEIDEKLKSNSQANVKLACTQSTVNDNYANSPNSSGSCTRSGYFHCPVCSNVRCYTTLQRRYGQFTCVACYRFFKEFFLKPTRFSCPFLGQCSLDVKSKCKACWILACTKVYSVDVRRKTVLEENAPFKSNVNSKMVSQSSASSSSSPIITNHQNETCKPLKSSQHNIPSATRYLKSIDERRSSASKGSFSFGNNFSNNQVNFDSSSNCDSSTVSKSSSIIKESVNNDGGDVDCNESPELAGLSALNMLNILSCEEAVDDELLEDIAEGYTSIDSQLNHFPPQKMIKLNYAHDVNNNLISNGFTAESNEQLQLKNETNKQLITTTTNTTTMTMTTTSCSTVQNDSINEKSSVPTVTGTPTSAIKSKPDRRSKARVKNWCCLKCAKCLADDCGQCINCLDRPKFGGPFIRKQRCINKKCLEKIQPDQPK